MTTETLTSTCTPLAARATVRRRGLLSVLLSAIATRAFPVDGYWSLAQLPADDERSAAPAAGPRGGAQ